MQHGFIKGGSTITQLLDTVHQVIRAIDHGLQTDVAFLDFSEAFDSVVVHTYPDIFESATFSFRTRLPSTPIQRMRWRIRNFLNTLSRVGIFEYVMNSYRGINSQDGCRGQYYFFNSWTWL